jgi:hypothetical protein
VIIVVVGDEDGIKLEISDVVAIEFDVGKSVAVLAEGILKNRIEDDCFSLMFDMVAGMKNAGEGENGPALLEFYSENFFFEIGKAFFGIGLSIIDSRIAIEGKSVL